MSKHLVSRVPRARQRTPRLDGPVFPGGQDRRGLSFGGGGPVRPLTCRGKGKLGGETRLQWSGKSNSGFQLTELDGETRLPIVTRVMERASIAALLMTVSWRPLWRRRLRLWLRCQHKGRLGQDLVIVFVHNTRIRMPCKRSSVRLTSVD